MAFLKITRTITELDRVEASKQKAFELCGAYLNEDKLAFRGRIQKEVQDCLSHYHDAKLKRVTEEYQPADPQGTHYKSEYLLLSDLSNEIGDVLVTKYLVKYIWNASQNGFEEIRPKEFLFEDLNSMENTTSSELFKKCEEFFKLSPAYKEDADHAVDEDGYKDRAFAVMFLNCALGIVISLVILAGLIYFNG